MKCKVQSAKWKAPRHTPGYMLIECLVYLAVFCVITDIAYVACGRLDGFWEFGLSPWDMAAGALLITEAGGLVGDLLGGPDFLSTGNVVCGTPKVFAQILHVVAINRDPTLSA